MYDIALLDCDNAKLASQHWHYLINKLCYNHEYTYDDCL